MMTCGTCVSWAGKGNDTQAVCNRTMTVGLRRRGLVGFSLTAAFSRPKDQEDVARGVEYVLFCGREFGCVQYKAKDTAGVTAE